jgi:DNA (cytosine-5)-methyltransferase 1
MEYLATSGSAFSASMRKDAEKGVLHDHVTRPVRDDDREAFSLMTSTTLYTDIPEELRRYTADTFDDKYKRLDWDTRSRSITAHIAKDGYWYIHPEEHRTLTVREAARIQTFPDRFRFAGHRSDAFRQIGNAVPPLLGEAAAKALLPRRGLRRGWSPPSSFERWSEVRQTLSAWARRQLDGPRWFLFPVREMTPTVAALTAMLQGSPTLHTSPDLAAGMAPLRGKVTIPARQLSRLTGAEAGSIVSAAVDRMRRAVLSPKQRRDPEAVALACALRPAERDVYRLLLAASDFRGSPDDPAMLLTNQAATRVASRLCGADPASRSSRSHGRLDLARVVGIDAENETVAAPTLFEVGCEKSDPLLLMAALQVIGSTVCRSRGARCAECPLKAVCPASTASTPA